MEKRKKIIDNLSNSSTHHNPESGWQLMQDISQGKENAQQELQLAWLQGDIDQPTYAILAHYQNLPDDYSGCLQKQGMLQISRHYAEQLQANPERAAAIYSHALQTQKMFKQACEYYQENLVGMLANPEDNLVNSILRQNDMIQLSSAGGMESGGHMMDAYGISRSDAEIAVARTNNESAAMPEDEQLFTHPHEMDLRQSCDKIGEVPCWHIQ